MLLNEVQVVADIAQERKTPVAFSTINVEKLNEELASQDIPMVLNSPTGVYDTKAPASVTMANGGTQDRSLTTGPNHF